MATILGFAYTFEEQPDGAKVCDVNNGGHRERMLSMPAFYRVYEPGQSSDVPAEPGTKPDVTIPDLAAMSLDALRAWAKSTLRLKIKGTFGHAKAVQAVEHELRGRGWIA
ncbi:hypothetical protein [Solidesulfovibrio sp.]